MNQEQETSGVKYTQEHCAECGAQTDYIEVIDYEHMDHIGDCITPQREILGARHGCDHESEVWDSSIPATQEHIDMLLPGENIDNMTKFWFGK